MSKMLAGSLLSPRLVLREGDGDASASGYVEFDRPFTHLCYFHSGTEANREREREREVGGRVCEEGGRCGGKGEEECDEVTKAPK